MSVTRAPSWLCAALLALLVGAVPGCGGGTIVFPGDDDDDDDGATVTVKGNLDDVSPVTTRDIVAFVFNIDDNSERCPCPPDPSGGVCDGGDDDGSACDEDVDCTGGGSCVPNRGKGTVLESGATEFTISGIDTGPIGVVFLLDNAGDLADGEIDPGDPIAILDDVDCELDDLEGNLTVTLEDIDILFSTNEVDPDTCQDGDPPAVGRARADVIRQERTTPE